MAAEPLGPGAVYRRCALAGRAFETSADLEDPPVPIAHARALEALRAAVGLRGGANVFALGASAEDARELVLAFLGPQAAAAPAPGDWCYVNDFARPHRPKALELPAGRATALRRDVEALVGELRAAIPAAFEGEAYRRRREALDKELEAAREQLVRAVQARAEGKGVAVLRTPVGFTLGSVRDGEVLGADEFARLPEPEQAERRAALQAVHDDLEQALVAIPRLEREHREKVKALNREVALREVGHLIHDVEARHADLPAVAAHLAAVRQDVLDNLQDFFGSSQPDDGNVAAQLRRVFSETPAFHRYEVNVLVDRAGAPGAPVVWEDLPTVPNLAGRIEHHVHFGNLVTDFTMIRAGALHRANGGYLVVDARRLLQAPFAWEQLKRSLRTGAVAIEGPERLAGFSGGPPLDPEPIPLRLTVVLAGERILHHLLCELDPDFRELFDVAADLDDTVERTPEKEREYARWVAAVARRERLAPLDRPALERIVEQAARQAEEADRLSTSAGDLARLLREAHRLAAGAGRPVVGRADVEAALAARDARGARLRDEGLRQLARGTHLVDTAGAAVGQINGLSVVRFGAHAFGRPSRITARVRLGRGQVLDIERESKLGGPIHSKGVLILASHLASRFAGDRPFALAATLVFEQSYGGVEGDSASCAELCALLSALAGVPLRQSIAVTGSVNQLGAVQPVGGVNEKVEGFFDACRERGAIDGQGVVIPAANARDLMLRADVVEAVAAGRFRVWTARSADEVIELLTGLPAGAPDATGAFPEGSVNARVAARIEALAARARAEVQERAR
jgi:lon-related putative ATP-dependent protease